MCALSHRIREEPNWWEKVQDKASLKKWKEEALQQEGTNEAPARRLTPVMVSFRHLRTVPPPYIPDVQISYVLEELRAYASLRDPETGIEVRLFRRFHGPELTYIPL